MTIRFALGPQSCARGVQAFSQPQATGRRAGIPNTVMPFMADQPFWGKSVHAIDAGLKPILVKDLSVEKLTQALVEAESQSLRKLAQVIGQQIRNEDGIGETVKLIEKYSNDFHRDHLPFANG
jgi:UDP:flavonoid glycosyltransferase YjiC (YdhE family)